MSAGAQESQSRAFPDDCLVWVLDDDQVLVGFLTESIELSGARSSGYVDPLAFLQRVDQGLPDQAQVLLCDLQMPGVDGIDLVRLLRARGFHHPVMLMSAHLDVARTIEAMREGFFDVITKPIDIEALLTELGKAISAACDAHALHNDATARARRVAQLTPREVDVMAGLSQGLMNKQVADLLHMSIKTVETHRQHIMQKLELRTAGQLLRFAIEWRMSQRPGGKPLSRGA